MGIYCLAAGCLVAGCQPTQSQSPSATSAANAPSAPAAERPARDRAAPKAATDLEQLAGRIVTQSAGIKSGELVLISGGSQDQELLENIAVHVRRLGAFPLVTLNSDRLSKRLFFDVPDKFDAQDDAMGMKLAETFDAVIFVNFNQEEGVLADADPKRQAARAKANQPVADTFVKRKVRQIEVGNGMYPTAWRAKRFGMSDDELAKTFWEGVNVDYADLAKRAEEVKKVMAGGREIRLKDANGSDLRVRIEGRPVFASDGIITEEEAKQGGAAVNVYLPAGEVYVTPVDGTAEGKIVRPRDYYQGKEIQDLTLTFAGGKLTSMTGSGPGFEPLKAFYDAAAAGKEMFAVVDLGINPRVKLPANAVVGTWVPAGTITVGVGNNVWAGGTNKAPFAYYVSLPGTTVMLDDKVIIENGQLKI
jgi:leucyl aminopeptidase (aminopeptidase T)